MSSVTKCRVLRHGNRSKESFVQVIALFCLKDLGAVLQKIPLTVCVCMRFGTVQVLECSYTALTKYCF
jgi:hypothetical protein